MEQHPYFLPKATEGFLELERPLVFFDLETTGTNVAVDRIVELCAIKLHPDGRQEELHELINPTIPIPPGATAVHQITDDMVAGKPTFAELAPTLADFFCNCDLGGYNIKRFDVPMLMEEFARLGKYPVKVSDTHMVDVMGIYHQREKRDLAAAVRFYCDRDHDGAHSAKADVLATIDVLKQQLLRYNDLQPNTSFLHNLLDDGLVDLSRRFVRDASGNIIFNFGKNKGKPVESDPGYLEWMLGGDFTADTKIAIKRIQMNIVWKRQLKEWLASHRILDNSAVASALYATLKFGQDIFPFSTYHERGRLTVTYLDEPPASYTFLHKDAQAILLQLLDEQLVPQQQTSQPAL
ncbi:MAG: 3'-5' exonuclease [Chitinophagaceae bacterium]|nr:MAG: 3'-5' exonuclease [Chitinophagaceae bacterium]